MVQNTDRNSALFALTQELIGFQIFPTSAGVYIITFPSALSSWKLYL